MQELLHKIQQTEFATLDMQLFLDTHPFDKEAIKTYNVFIFEAKKLREEYEKNYGPLFSYITKSNENNFSWIDGWPWEINKE
ncbi:MAG: spore coat protein CotJB [Firmicutes bacterium]|nr:spore coat protein CotJB [Bacillota bacterium]